MPSQKEMDAMYMKFAITASKMSKARRKQVGGVLVKRDNIISFGWNGTPAGEDNNCEDELDDGTLVTREHVVSHCELNIFGKLLASDYPVSTSDSTLYITISPCNGCAKLIKRSGTSEVVFLEEYRDTAGIDFLRERGVNVRQFQFDEDGGETQI